MPKSMSLNQNQALIIHSAGCVLTPATLNQVHAAKEILYAEWLHNRPMLASWKLKEIRSFLSSKHETVG